MRSFRIGSVALALVFCVSCFSLNYPTEYPGSGDSTQPRNSDTSSGALVQGAEEPYLESPLSWSDLTRLAREHMKINELDQARERLAQAALQVQPLPATHARRRAVFGMRARLAMRLASADKIDSADELADELLAEAEQLPALGGSALVLLALSVNERRQAESQLPLLRIAISAAQAGAANRDRMNLASRVATVAYQEKDLALARRAIDQAVADARLLGPSKKIAIAALELRKSQIALSQADLEAAETAATVANQMFEEAAASASSRGAAEAVLAEILANRGETEKALSLAKAAQARIDGEEPIQGYPQRLILGSLARVERMAGNFARARLHFEQALAIPAAQSAMDDDLIEQLRIEFQRIESQEVEELGATSMSPSASE